jgi:riboflavin synthase
MKASLLFFFAAGAACPVAHGFKLGGGAATGRHNNMWTQKARRSPPSTSTSTSTTIRDRSSVVREMFSGIVEEMGQVVSLTKNEAMELWDGSVGEGTELVIKADVALDGAYEGASICVNGVCTTVVTYDGSSFKVGLAPETLRRSDLDGRNSGHCVQGHVDCTGEILSRHMEGESLWVKIAPQDKDLMRFIVPKGFIAVDGTSLTVCEVNVEEGWFTFMLVAYTQSKIVVAQKEEGQFVNLEADVFGKYVERSMTSLLERVESLEATVRELQAAKL